ncbi:hypothetical protein CMV_007845 [Castanea mollissima]|uniref:Uncharacterized protein n=1 Tax=Castanea mollissima TaxID=60419 RepID=A0A8J4RTX9_9ROSI|nr:hypothetical protein CMV_007845 [Castanea mollissima]
MLKNHFEPVFENLQRIYDGIYFNRVGAGIWSLFSMPPPRTRVGTLHSIREKKASKDGCSSLCCETREAAGSRWWRGTNS